MTPRERLTQARYDSLATMIEAYAAEAVRSARAEYRETLTYGLESLDRLEAILNRLCPAPDPLPAHDADWLTLLWGSWFGELLRSLHGGAWSMTIYPGSELSVPTLEIGSRAAAGDQPSANASRLYPMMKVHRRLTLGSGESLPAFYRMVAARLAAPAAEAAPAHPSAVAPPAAAAPQEN